MSATLRFAVLFVPALVFAALAQPRPHLAGATEPLRVQPTEPAQVQVADPAQPFAFDVGPAAPSGVAKSESRTRHDTGPREPEQRRRNPGGGGPRTSAADPGSFALLSNADPAGAEARALACDRLRFEFGSLRHAERANRYIFGSTAPPSLL